MNIQYQIKDLIKQEFKITNDAMKIKVSKIQMNNFLIKNRLNENDVKLFIINKKKDSFTLQLQKLLNPTINGLSNSQAQKMADQFISPEKVPEYNNKVNTYTNAFKAYRKQIVYNYFTTDTIKDEDKYDIIECNKVFNNIYLSKLNVHISKELINYSIEYKKDFIFKNMKLFLLFLKDSFNINSPLEFINIKFKLTDEDKKLIINRNRFMRNLKNDFLKKDKNKFLQYFQTFEFEKIVNQVKESKN